MALFMLITSAATARIPPMLLPIITIFAFQQAIHTVLATLNGSTMGNVFRRSAAFATHLEDEERKAATPDDAASKFPGGLPTRITGTPLSHSSSLWRCGSGSFLGNSAHPILRTSIGEIAELGSARLS